MRTTGLTPMERTYYDDGWMAAHRGYNVGPLWGRMPEPYWRGFADRLEWALTDPATSIRALYPHKMVDIAVQQQALAYLRRQAAPMLPEPLGPSPNGLSSIADHP